MTYLLLGEDEQLKQVKISEFKHKYLPSSDALQFDIEILHGTKLDSKTLKKALIALPAVASRRLLIIYSCHKLNAHNKKLIEQFVSSGDDHAVLVLESSQMTFQDAFVKKISSFVKVIGSSVEQKSNVFDMTRAITQRRSPEALKILQGLLLEGIHPLQIMGGVVWAWAKLRERVPQKRFEKGLMALRDADLDIKRSRIKPDYALELLVVKLCVILN